MDWFCSLHEQSAIRLRLSQLSDVTAKWGNTSNLLTHLKTPPTGVQFHSIVKPKLATCRSGKKDGRATGQLTIEASVNCVRKFRTGSKEHRQMTTAVTCFLAKEMLPIYTIDKAGFQDMVHSLNLWYNLPHKDYFSCTAIPSLYEDSRQRRTGIYEFQWQLFLFSYHWPMVVLYFWTFLVYTIHYIDSEWTLQSHCLKALYIPQDHTGENLQEVLGLFLED